VYVAFLLINFISAEFISAWSLPEGREVAPLPPALTLESLVISHGEILNTCISQIDQPGRYKIWNSKE
jgi:hypothetical protein